MDTGNATSSPTGTTGGVCHPGVTGCSCDTPGAQAACGYVSSKSGNYVTCSIGKAACQGGAWGACVQDYVVTKSLGKSTLGSTHVLSTTLDCPSGDAAIDTDGGACDDPCDVDLFRIVTSGPDDVDAASTLKTDAGVTINPVCTDLSCQLATNCPANSPTTLSGTVYDPAGVNPLYNAHVYIPVDPSGQLPAFSAGASCSACAGMGNVPVVAEAMTGPDGKFVLTNVPTTDVAPGNPIPLVVELGKWRRETLLTSVPACQTVPVIADNSRLPRSKFDGNNGQADIPKMAIATGSQDPFQCLLLKMGLDPAEFQTPNSSSNRRIDYYVGNQGMQVANGTAPPESNLVGSTATLMNYDIVILPCGGKPVTSMMGSYPQDDVSADNVAAYANGGGRLFATHYGLTWLAMPKGNPLVAQPNNPATNKVNPFYGVANWAIDSSPPPPTVTGIIDTGTPKGGAFSTWMQTVGASATAGQLPIDVARQDTTAVKPPATEFIHDVTPDGGAPLFLSFDTPLGSGSPDAGAGACGRVSFADFHVSPTALADPSGDCASDSDCGFGATCIGGVEGLCTTAVCGGQPDDCPGQTCILPGGPANTCIPQHCNNSFDCSSGICNPNGTCGCTMGSQCKSGTCDTSVCVAASAGSCVRDQDCGDSEVCSSGANPGYCQKGCVTDADCLAGCPANTDCGHELCVSGICQGAFTDTDCQSGNCVGCTPPHCSQKDDTFPLGCRQGPLTPQEDALEFMLFDLTSCVSTAPPVPPPPPTYRTATFTEDVTSNCPVGTRPIWRELSWLANIPPTAEIDFSAQTADPPEDGGPTDYTSVQIVPVAQATTISPTREFLDTGNNPTSTGVFNLATPPVSSRSQLRLTITLKPTTDTFGAPTLIQWQVKADCLVAE